MAQRRDDDISCYAFQYPDPCRFGESLLQDLAGEQFILRDYLPKAEPGDLIEIDRGLYQHWAIYDGNGYIIHLAPASEEACGGSNSMMSVLHDRATVKRDKLWDVMGTREFIVNNLLDDKYEPRSVSAILKDARSRVGQMLPYDVAQYNCEHFVTELRYGKPESRQVRRAEIVGLGVGAATIFGLMALAGPDLSDNTNEQRSSQGDEARQ